MKKCIIILIVLITGYASAQNKNKPKLIVGIVVDQMRHDYIYRYWDKYGNGGFKKLIKGGYFCKNANYNYVPTYTGPGHASIYTGTTPATHGIIANDWYSKDENKIIYCAEDNNVNTVGSTSKAGKMSPKNLLTTTIGDELKLSNIQKSKVIGVSLKDRSSIMPAGHSADAAYWFDGSTGAFITSTHYMQQLPTWLNNFNAKQLAKQYLQQGWNTLLPIDQYIESIADNNNYETAPNKKDTPTFPYEYSKQLEKNNYEILRATPWGNTITKDLAIEALKNEQLGKDNYTDILAISFSSTDYVGHSYGPKSIEVEDVYLRLDKELEQLITAIEKEVGVGNFTLFLTADHGACDNANYLKSNKIPAGYADADKMELELKTFLFNQYGDSLVNTYINQQVFLNDAVLFAKKLNKEVIEKQCAEFFMKYNGVAETYTAVTLQQEAYTPLTFKYLVQKGYNFKRSGDLAVAYNAAWMEYMEKGTTHGAAYSYDTHVPLIFYGNGINKGVKTDNVNIVDIAPTLSMLLDISFPNGCTGEVITEVLKK